MIPATGNGTRLMWYPGKAAFRAGRVLENQWEDTEIGPYSVAFGLRVTAKGVASVAMGDGATADGNQSAAIGFQARASGQNSIAMGALASASGLNSIAMGTLTVASSGQAVALGRETEASGLNSTATGLHTVASGNQSTAMGHLTVASGHGSTAIGSFAQAAHSGSFVYGDASTSTTTQSTGGNQFVVRAAGGTTFYSNATLSAGVSLATGGGAWATISDVNRKSGFRELDGEVVLGQVAAMPIREWSYKSQSPNVRHVGPTAQDFYAAFGLGTSDLTITTSDISGINILAVQALERRTRELRQAMDRISKQAERIEFLQAALERQVLRLDGLEARLANSARQRGPER